jgi:hypothetical protein
MLETPYWLHPYQYAYSNPVLWTDPSGEFVGGERNKHKTCGLETSYQILGAAGSMTVDTCSVNLSSIAAQQAPPVPTDAIAWGNCGTVVLGLSVGGPGTVSATIGIVSTAGNMRILSYSVIFLTYKSRNMDPAEIVNDDRIDEIRFPNSPLFFENMRFSTGVGFVLVFLSKIRTLTDTGFCDGITELVAGIDV